MLKIYYQLSKYKSATNYNQRIYANKSVKIHLIVSVYALIIISGTLAADNQRNFADSDLESRCLFLFGE